MTLLTYSYTLSNGTTADADQVQTMFNEAKAILNGNIDNTNITPGGVGTVSLADAGVTYAKLGANVTSILTGLGGNVPGGAAARGKAIIPGVEIRTNAAFGLLATPDQVAGIVLPTDGLIRVRFHALWKGGATSDAPRAAIFLGANQLKIATQSEGAAPVTQEAEQNQTGSYAPLVTFPGGLIGHHNAGDNSLVGTGMALDDPSRTGYWYKGTTQVISSGGAQGMGTECLIFADAGTYTVSVQFRSSAGEAVSVKNRKLWVEAVGF